VAIVRPHGWCTGGEGSAGSSIVLDSADPLRIAS
jgi:hypothetical protein